MLKRLFIISCLLLCAYIPIAGQLLPSSIRGYKVQTAKIFIATSDAEMPRGRSRYDAVIRLGRGRIESVGISGLQVRAPLEVTSSKVTGEIEFISFSDFTIDGSSISIGEIRPSLKLPKKGIFPIRHESIVTISGPGILKAGFRSASGSAKILTISGTLLVFGSFDKLGMKFKRVIPVRIHTAVPNPLAKP